MARRGKLDKALAYVYLMGPGFGIGVDLTVDGSPSSTGTGTGRELALTMVSRWKAKLGSPTAIPSYRPPRNTRATRTTTWVRPEVISRCSGVVGTAPDARNVAVMASHSAGAPSGVG